MMRRITERVLRRKPLTYAVILWNQIKRRSAWNASNVTKHTELLGRDLGIEQAQAEALLRDAAELLHTLADRSADTRAVMTAISAEVERCQTHNDNIDIGRFNAYVAALNEPYRTIYLHLRDDKKPQEIADLLQLDKETTQAAMAKIYSELRMATMLNPGSTGKSAVTE